MQTTEIKREANHLFKSLAPVWALGTAIEDVVLRDLAKVVQVCGRSHGALTAHQLLAYLVVFALVKHDRDKLNVALRLWDFGQERARYEKETLQILLEFTKNSQDDELLLPSLLRQLDRDKGSDLLSPTVIAVSRFAQVIIRSDEQVTIPEIEALSAIWQSLHTYRSLEAAEQKLLTQLAGAVPPAAPSPEALEQVIAELNDLVGMDNIKESIQTLTNFLKVQQVRSQRGLAKTPVSLHMVFMGAPGTGKTTVARLMGRIYKSLGFLAKGHLIETDRPGMVAGYVGQTAKKTDDLINSALDGVLFIDEAYSLVPAESGNDFGREAIEVLLKRMEDYRDRLVVIVAGYSDEMTAFIESNPGLKSRFNRYFYFNDYAPTELATIFDKLCSKNNFNLTPEAAQKLQILLEELYQNRDRTFGNARLVRNLFEKTIERQANRIAGIASLTDEILTTLMPEDLPSVAAVTPARRHHSGGAEARESEDSVSNLS